MNRFSKVRRKWGSKSLLITLMVAPMLLLAVAVGFSAWVEDSDATIAATKILFGQINERIADHLSSLFDSALAINSMNRTSFQIGELELAKTADIEKHLISLMRSHPDISSTYVGSLSGGLVDAGREGAGGAEYVIETPGFTAGPFIKSSINAQGGKGKLVQQVAFFDARTRPWYRAAIEAGHPIWIEPFALFSGQESAISSACPIFDGEGRAIGVASVDIFLSQVGTFLRQLNGELGGTSFLVDDRGRLVASTSDARIFGSSKAGNQAERIFASQSTNPLIAAASAAIAKESISSSRFYSFTSKQEQLVALVTVLPDSGDLRWRIVTAYPEKTIMAPVVTAARNSMFLIAGATILLCIFAVLIANMLAARFQQFSEFFSAVATNRGGYFPNHMRESSIREIDWLQRDLFSMRAGLDKSFAQLKDEIEVRKRSEADLSESKKAYDRLARTIPVGIYLLCAGKDGRHHYDYLSPRFREIMGFGPEDPIVGPESYMSRMRGTDLDSYISAQTEALATLSPFTWEGNLTVNGKLRRLRVESIPEIQEGSDTLWHGVLSDVTEQKKMEEEIRASETRFRVIFDNSKDGIGVHINGIWKYCNEAAIRMFGASSREDLIGTPITQVIAQSERQRIIDYVHRRREKNEAPTAYITKGLRKDGHEFELEVELSSFSLDGEHQVLVMLRDISGRKRAERALVESESRFRLLFENMEEGFSLHEIIVNDVGEPVDFRFLEANASYEGHTGQKPMEIIGKTIIEVMPQVDRHQIKNYGAIALGGGPQVFEYFSKSFNKYMRVHAYSPTHGQFATIFEDVTESKRAQEQIESLLREKEMLLKEVHHRIKNNMNTAASILYLQGENEHDERIVNALETASRRLRSMGVLYDKLYRSENVTSVSMKEYLPALVSDIHDNFPNKDSVEVAIEVGDFRLSASKTMALGLIVNELVTNSMKHAFAGISRGKISISASLTGGSATIIVSDNGVGMPEFSALNPSKGFGMELIEGLVAQLDGEFRNERGTGTKSIISFTI